METYKSWEPGFESKVIDEVTSFVDPPHKVDVSVLVSVCNTFNSPIVCIFLLKNQIAAPSINTGVCVCVHMHTHAWESEM